MRNGFIIYMGLLNKACNFFFEKFFSSWLSSRGQKAEKYLSDFRPIFGPSGIIQKSMGKVWDLRLRFSWPTHSYGCKKIFSKKIGAPYYTFRTSSTKKVNKISPTCSLASRITIHHKILHTYFYFIASRCLSAGVL